MYTREEISQLSTERRDRKFGKIFSYKMSEKKSTFSICVMWLIVPSGLGIVLKDFDSASNNTDNDWQCLEPRRDNENLLEVGESVFECAKKNLFIGLVRNVNSECVDIGDGVSFVKQKNEEISPRDIFPTEEEPATVRGLMNAYSNFLSQRGVRWDLGFVYPGLVMRIGPSLNGAGVLEFSLDRRLDYADRAKLGPGQVIVRRTILPHLLGFRMNLSSLLPLIIAIVIFITKNAFVFSKVTLVLSVLLTLKSLFLLQAFRQPQHQDHHTDHHPIHSPHRPIANDPVDFGDMIVTTVNRPRPQGYSVSETSTDALLLQMVNSFPPYRNINDKKVPKRSKETSGKRNFSWEKK